MKREKEHRKSEKPECGANWGTEQTGTVRVSVSAFNTSREITAFLAAMQALV